jgi:uncharacterized protein YfaT (DUF1175 family)
MIATTWHNGSHHPSGAGYGLKLQSKDRNRYFKRDWKTVMLELEGDPHPVEVNIDKPSFWGSVCREVINKHIGLWLIENGLAPWPKGKPPKLNVIPLSERRFAVKRPVKTFN